MRLVLALLIGIVFATSPSFAGDHFEEWIEEAVIGINAAGTAGDTSGPERRLRAIVDEDPTHLEALWLLTNMKLTKLINRGLMDRSSVLFQTGPAIEHIVALANKKGNQAFGHFVRAEYAKFYKSYNRALSEIDRALALEPTSTRYLASKGRILIDKGDWERSDAVIEDGLRILSRAHQQSKTHPSIFYDEEKFHFGLAWGISQLSRPRYQEVVQHYLAAIKHGPHKTTPRAFSWNNVSIAYRKLGQCEQARDAAEQALEIMEFGAATSNRQYAKFCLEMQKLGIMSIDR